jgi:hypothetical protein
MLKYKMLRMLLNIAQQGVGADLGLLGLNSELLGENETQTMKAESDTAGADISHRCKPITKLLLTLTVSLALFLLAIGNIQQYVTGQAARIFDTIRIPVITVNGDLWPINYEANRRHMFSFDAIVLKDTDHFLMINRPDEFNRALEEAIAKVLEKPAK